MGGQQVSPGWVSRPCGSSSQGVGVCWRSWWRGGEWECGAALPHSLEERRVYKGFRALSDAIRHNGAQLAEEVLTKLRAAESMEMVHRALPKTEATVCSSAV
jgi:hypothetical protein